MQNDFRLPNTVIPEHYELTIWPDLHGLGFVGDVAIDVRVRKPTNEIVLNAVELRFRKAFAQAKDGTRMEGTVRLDKETERAIISFKGNVGRGKWTLHLSFVGRIGDNLRGLYKSVYTDASGVEHKIAITQCFPNDARRVIPCFDEPAFKATFSLTIAARECFQVVANAPIESEEFVPNSGIVIEENDGRNFQSHTVAGTRIKKTRFAKTMKMSTYLLAFAVGELECTEPLVVDGIPVRVWCVPGKKHLANFALKVAEFSLRWYRKYFRIAYPAAKLDMIGIPDIAYGAMENLGCITFRETAVLVDEQSATIADLETVAEVVAHEIAHQWFGNLVTMRWFNGLWLNEAFATFTSLKVQAALRPELQRWATFGVERATAFAKDGLSSTRCIEAAVDNPADAVGMVDTITYLKGCSVLRQLEQFIGDEAFRRGIAEYLRKHSYGNTETGDLWSAIQKFTKQPVRRMMDGWIFQPGYPVVSVSESSVNGCITLGQERFGYLPSDDKTLWSVPLCLRFGTADGTKTAWVLLDQAQKTVYLGEEVSWVVVNAGAHGFFRTRYSPTLAAKLTADLNQLLTPVERFNLLNDAWACTKAGLQTSEDYLSIARLFANETDPNVWTVLDESLRELHRLVPPEARQSFEALVRSIATPTFDKLGWQTREIEDSEAKRVRPTVIYLLGTAGGDTTIREQALHLFASYLTDKSALPADVVPEVTLLVAKNGAEEEYARFDHLRKETNVPQEARRYLFALASFPQLDLLERTLQATINGEVRSQDAPSLMVRLLANPAIAARAWEFIEQNWDRLVAAYSESNLIDMVEGVTALDTPEQEARVRAFFSEHKVKGGDDAVSQSLEALRIAVLFRQREAVRLAALFATTPGAAS